MKKHVELTVRVVAEVDVDPAIDVDDHLYVKFPKGLIEIIGKDSIPVGEAYEHETVFVEELE